MEKQTNSVDVFYMQGCSGAWDGVPPLFSTGTPPPLSPLFWTEIRAKVSPLL